MAYGEVTGWKTVFPTATAAPKKGAAVSTGGLSRGGRSSKTAAKPRAPKKTKAKTVPKTLSYPKVTSKNPLRAPTTGETVVGAIGAKKGLAVLRNVATKLKGLPARAPGALTVALMAGAIAYGLTKYGLTAYALKKATLRENAARAADAYRAARLKIASDQGRELTATQQKQLATAFKNELLKLGLSSSDLSKIMGRSAYDPTTQAAIGG